MGQRIRLGHDQLCDIIKERVKKSLNEIDARTLVGASERSVQLVKVLDEIDECFGALESALGDITSYEGQRFVPANREIKEIYYEVTRLWDRFKKIHNRKTSQRDNFEDEYIRQGRPDVD